MAWKTINSETIVSDKYCTVKRNQVQLPDGAEINDFYTVTIPDAALVVAITSDSHIILKREYRFACGEDILECPAGMVESGEDPLTTAKRELLEETGYVSDQWTWFGATRESTSKLTNRMWLFMARDCKKVSDQRLDRNEQVEVIRIPLAEAVEMVMENQINANSSAHAILKAENPIKRCYRFSNARKPSKGNATKAWTGEAEKAVKENINWEKTIISPPGRYGKNRLYIPRISSFG